MADIKPFQIQVPDEGLRKLKQRLELTEFPNVLSDAGDRYGAPLPDIKRLVNHWQTKFDWRAQEKRLNEIPQFTTEISVDGYDPIDLHFVHQKSGSDNAIPLLFVHGWPGSFIEVTKLLPLLKGGDGKPAFDIIAPSLPNYGFSSRIDKSGFSAVKYAETFHQLMLKLGYNQYVTQGGDWGRIITRLMSALYPDHCKACHINFPSMTIRDTSTIEKYVKTEQERKAVNRGKQFAADGRGYFGQQATRPATLNYGLRDSPVALLAWIYEKLVEWTDEYPWTDDEVLTWISIFWFSRAGPDASTYIYYETTHDPAVDKLATQNVAVPFALAYFPKELYPCPPSMLEDNGFNVQQVTWFDKGGHFAAWEKPEDVAADVIKFFGKGGAAAGVVDGRSG